MRDHSYSSTHPPLPPTTEDDRVSWLRLLRSRRVGVATFWRLLSEHGTAQAALQALPEVARAAGVQKYDSCPEGVVLAEMKAARARGARLVCRGEAAYPTELAEIDDAPPLLWVIGDTAALSRPMIALVGARNASSLGLRMARSLSADLGQAGYQIVSGLARGIDTAAHLESLDTGTVAVMAGGVDVLYPSENTRLAEDIVAKGGALISEQPMGLQPMARHFPTRNRIVSGLARAVVVVEAAAKSGSLITARTALDQGREVLAVPGHPMDARASGCNILIRDGARLVRNGADVLETLPDIQTAAQPDLPGFEEEPLEDVVARLPQTPAPKRSLRDTAKLHLQILKQLGPSPVAEDQLIRDLGAPSGEVAPALTDLELEGRVQRKPGGFLTLVPDAGETRH
ncbi:DNA-processing protein DprA [Tropicibacter sp. R15_0]|uniref:DNA-processing protein DprA n=1 Tax=Tropicibacter sp. R15_0 TaxID=2821101 RepID=UPI001AD96985|nr:DNA-processing protein DprA [Tropicibacter sp. R15_0]MBO9465212.1 DNA-processing protein DprA [Tropicibacter sp. R15_0]